MPKNLLDESTTPRWRGRGLRIRSLHNTPEGPVLRPVEPSGYSLVFATGLVSVVNVTVHSGLISHGGPTAVILYWMCLPAALLLGWVVPTLSRQDRTPRLFGAAIGFLAAILTFAPTGVAASTGKWVLGVAFVGTASAELLHRLYQRSAGKADDEAEENQMHILGELENQLTASTADDAKPVPASTMA